MSEQAFSRADVSLAARCPSGRPAVEGAHAASGGMPKVVFVESAAEMGGVEFSTLYLTQRMNRGGWDPLVVCPAEGELSRACCGSGVPVRVVTRPALRSTSVQLGKSWRVPNPLAWVWDVGTVFVAARKLARVLSDERTELVVTKGMFAHIYGGLAARLLGVPCVWHVQDFVSERFLGVYRRAFARLARWLPQHVVADGRPIARQLAGAQSGISISVVYNGVDTEVFRPAVSAVSATEVRKEFGIPPEAFVVGNVARITPWKGQHHLLEAFARVARRYPRAHLLLVGSPVFESDAYELRLRKMASDHGIEDRVCFAGFRRDLPRVLTAMDIFAHTSVEKDTSPLALLSAMSAALPVVAFDIEGVREVVGPGEEGILVPVGDENRLAEAFGELLSDDRLRRRLAIGARARAEAEFSLERYVTSMDGVFLEELSRAKSGRSRLSPTKTRN
jgi:glycosyltransferase involved in cell wall biosynthesis